MRQIAARTPTVLIPIVLTLIVPTLAAVTVGAAAAQMPDSPTGRMVSALVELAGSEDPAAVDAFVAERLAASMPAERLNRLREDLEIVRRECGGAGGVNVRKTGPFEVTVGMATANGRCEIAVMVESEAPHGLIGLGLNVMLGPAGSDGMNLDLPAGDDAALAEALDRRLAAMAEADEFSGVVLLARDGEPIFHRAYGLADRASGRAITVDTRFDVGSITKRFTKTAIAQLAAAGKLDLDATLLSVLPDYPNPEVGSRITIRQLVAHTSGLGDIFNDRWETAEKSKLRAPRDFFPLFVDLPLAFEPGSTSAYSNAGYIVLGAIVEELSRLPYAEYLEAKIFAPAGMTASGFPARDGADPTLAIGYTRQGEGDGLAPNLGMLPIAGCPAGSSSHTAADLLKFELALRSGKLLDPVWTAWLYTGRLEPDPERGWEVGIAGGGPGVSAVLEAGPESTVVVLANLDPPVATELGMPLGRALRR